MKMVKSVVSIVMVCVMALSMAACGGSSSGAMSEADYKKALENIGTAMTDIQNSSFDMTDPEQAKKTLTDMKKIFTDAAAISAPDKYKDAQAKVKSGSEAMARFIDVSLKALDGGQPSEDEQSAMITDLTSAINDLAEGFSLAGLE